MKSIARTQTATPVDLLDAIDSSLGRATDLSGMLFVLADFARREKDNPDLTVEAWAGVAIVQEDISQGVAAAKKAARELFELAIAGDKAGAR